ncbi:MAG: Hypothetical protein BHV28_15370 [Candidatus Tokpelaia hoelldobleri]|uniref:DUF218 domain-containing protein n=1 Tax=Candidatus Tokpelaia hoelldobleri TaxID=1902579 RepID=A0A1U9JWG1_9HYPH|nr:MAG: Hypothetical protein BHV28_15370 [Candidatus Tokpelaia hoelldoblerii]
MGRHRKTDQMPEAAAPRRLRRRLSRHLPPLLLFCVFALVLFGGGFVYFCEHISRIKAPLPLPVSDGILVLTGGRSRLETGIELLERGRGRRLLISGVNPQTSRDSLMRITQTDPALFECCVDLGRDALNTSGNAEESAAWVQEHGYHRVYVVTNNYHMPRALKELRRSMPGIDFIPYPVVQEAAVEESALQFVERQRVLMGEYVKFLGVSLRNLLW